MANETNFATSNETKRKTSAVANTEPNTEFAKIRQRNRKKETIHL